MGSGSWLFLWDELAVESRWWAYAWMLDVEVIKPYDGVLLVVEVLNQVHVVGIDLSNLVLFRYDLHSFMCIFEYIRLWLNT